MRIFDVGGLPSSLGEIINFKYHLDIMKTNYDKIIISFHKALWNSGLHTNTPDWPQRKKLWEKYINDIGILFFSEVPYEIKSESTKFAGDITQFIANTNIRPQKVELAHLLCNGTSLNLGSEYIVLTTKIRAFEQKDFMDISSQFWDILKQLSQKYKLVILGERLVEMRKEYLLLNPKPFGIYDLIIRNIPIELIIDLTVPALGETVSDLTKIQQDSLIMNEAKFVITFGTGGNFCLSTAVSNMTIGYRKDNTEFNNIIYDFKEYPDAIVTKDPNRFLTSLRAYL